MKIFDLFLKKYWGTKASGIMFICAEDETILLLKRADFCEQPGTWGIPGGALNEGFYRNNHKQKDPDDNAFIESAKREVLEEIGYFPKNTFLAKQTIFNDGDFTYKTFVYIVDFDEKQKFQINLNKEHTEYKWFKFDNLPENMHFGVEYSLQIMKL